MDITKRQMDILDAAIRIIAHRGYRELTTKNLAKELRLTEAALYRHFKSKSDLMTSLLTYFGEVSEKVLLGIRDQACNPWEKIERFILNRFEIFFLNPDLGSVMFSEELFRNDPELLGHMKKIMHGHHYELLGYLQEAQCQGLIRKNCDATQLFRIIIGSFRFTITQWILSDRGFDLVTEGKKLVNTINYLMETNNEETDHHHR